MRLGTTIDDPNYPLLLNKGYVHASQRETDEEGNPSEAEDQNPTVGPYRFMEEGQADTEDEVARIWKVPIK